MYSVLVAESMRGEGWAGSIEQSPFSNAAAHESAVTAWSWVTYETGLSLDEARLLARQLIGHRPRCEIRIDADPFAHPIFLGKYTEASKPADVQASPEGTQSVPSAPEPATTVYVAHPDRYLGSFSTDRRDFSTIEEAHAHAADRASSTGQPWVVFPVNQGNGSWGLPTYHRPARKAA